MRIYISVDAEGMPGIYTDDQTSPKGSRYLETRELMTDLTLFACEELHKKGVDEILLADSHDGMGNIFYERIPDYVSLIRGSRRPISMMYGIERKFDGALFLGYHAAAGSFHANFDHIYTYDFTEIRINDRRASEFYFNMLVAGKYKVPVILVAGDNVLEEDVKENAPWAQYVRFKESITRHSNISPSLNTIKNQLKEKIKTAMDNLEKAKFIDLSPIRVVFKLKDTQAADLAEIIPGLERIDAYSLVYSCADAGLAYRMMEVIAHLTAVR
jgi:D-amino peptidase